MARARVDWELRMALATAQRGVVEDFVEWDVTHSTNCYGNPETFGAGPLSEVCVATLIAALDRDSATRCEVRFLVAHYLCHEFSRIPSGWHSRLKDALVLQFTSSNGRTSRDDDGYGLLVSAAEILGGYLAESMAESALLHLQSEVHDWRRQFIAEAFRFLAQRTDCTARRQLAYSMLERMAGENDPSVSREAMTQLELYEREAAGRGLRETKGDD